MVDREDPTDIVVLLLLGHALKRSRLAPEDHIIDDHEEDAVDYCRDKEPQQHH